MLFHVSVTDDDRGELDIGSELAIRHSVPRHSFDGSLYPRIFVQANSSKLKRPDSKSKVNWKEKPKRKARFLFIRSRPIKGFVGRIRSRVKPLSN